MPPGNPGLEQFADMFRLLFVGDDDTGKSCCVESFAEDPFCSNYAPTIGVDFRMHDVYLDERTITLEIFHAAGQARFREYISAFYRSPQGIVIVYDATRQKTFDNVQNWIEELRQHTSVNTPLLLLGNKCDLTEEKVVDYETAKDFADEHNIPFFEVSAKDGTNVELSVMTLVTLIMQNQACAAPMRRYTCVFSD